MFQYFGYGSNMDITSIRAKGVNPHHSVRAVLPRWRLSFDVQHFFAHEGGVGNIRPSGDPRDEVQGVVHLCDDEAMAHLDAAEAFGHGYEREEIDLQTEEGPLRAIAYVGHPSFINPACRPSRRYLNILVAGATHAGLDPAYIARLDAEPTHAKRAYPPFVHPPRAAPRWTEASLAEAPHLTGLWGAVFDMTEARRQHEFLRGFFGGRDMTLFHLKRMDSSDGREVLDDLRLDRLNPEQRTYLNEYLNEYEAEYRCVGRIDYGPPKRASDPG